MYKGEEFATRLQLVERELIVVLSESKLWQRRHRGTLSRKYHQPQFGPTGSQLLQQLYADILLLV